MQTMTRGELDQDVSERIERLAQGRRLSAAGIMREAIEQYVERAEQGEHMRAVALSAYERYQATGQHVSAEDADAWLARLEAGEDAEAPRCHD